MNEKWRRTAHGSDILKRKGYHENQCIEVHRIIWLMNMDNSHRKTSKHYLYQVCLLLSSLSLSLFSLSFSLYITFSFSHLFSLYLLGFQTLKNTLWNHPQKPLFLDYFPIKSLYRFYLFLRNILSLYYKLKVKKVEIGEER